MTVAASAAGVVVVSIVLAVESARSFLAAEAVVLVLASVHPKAEGGFAWSQLRHAAVNESVDVLCHQASSCCDCVLLDDRLHAAGEP